MTDDKMDVSITVEADLVSNRVFTQVQNLLREGQSEPFEKANLGWVLFGIAAQDSGKIGKVHKVLEETDGAPFNDVMDGPEREEIEEILKELESEGVLESNDSVWTISEVEIDD